MCLDFPGDLSWLDGLLELSLVPLGLSLVGSEGLRGGRGCSGGRRRATPTASEASAAPTKPSARPTKLRDSRTELRDSRTKLRHSRTKLRHSTTQLPHSPTEPHMPPTEPSASPRRLPELQTEPEPRTTVEAAPSRPA